MQKHTILLAILYVLLPFLSFSQSKNINLLGHLSYLQDLNDIWGYADSSGNEYALVGTRTGTSIVDVTNPKNPAQLFFVPGFTTTWRDLKTWNHYCYVTNEHHNGGGLLIIDLQYLPDSIKTYNWNGAGSVTFDAAHNLFIDEKGFAYIFGADYSNGGAIIADLKSNPIQPTIATVYDLAYIHDGFVRGDTMWAGELNNGWFSVVDVSDKNPASIPSGKVMATHPTPDKFTHNTWLSNNGDFLFTTDEVSNGYIGSYDVSDLNNIQEVDRVQSSQGQNVIPHNTFFHNDFLITSYYRDGVVIMDATYPDNIIETGFYDTSPLSGNGFNGTWGVYPYLPSGNIIASDIENGLFVLGPQYIKAAYLEGIVRDSSNNNPIIGVDVKINGVSSSNTSTSLKGLYKTGVADSGSYVVEFSKPGYITKTVTVNLDNGVVNQQNIKLIPLVPFTLTGYVFNQETGKEIDGAQIKVFNKIYNYKSTTDSSGKFTIQGMYADTYTLIAGKWGLITTEITNQNYSQFSTTDTFYLLPGYYDDFALDFQWKISGNAASGSWERDVPVGTTFLGNFYNPADDVMGDIGKECYITGNDGGAAGNDDVDDGRTTLTSPIFDLSGMNNPYISYARWFANGGGSSFPDDSLVVYLHNGMQRVLLDFIDGFSTDKSEWKKMKFKVEDYISPTDSMQIQFTTADQSSSGHLVEAGLDLFQAFDSIQVPIAGFRADTTSGCAPLTIQFMDESDHFPYEWMWIIDNSDTLSGPNPTYTFFTTGSYTIKLFVKNSAGTDSLEQQQYIKVFSSPAANATSTPDKNNQGNGSASVSVSGGTPPFSYQWDDSSQQTSDTATGLSAGFYTVTVVDSNGCKDTASVNISSVTGLFAPSNGDLMIYPNPTNDLLNIEFSTDITVSSITLYDFQGKEIPFYVVQRSKQSLQIHLSKTVVPGTYLLHIVSGTDVWTERILIQP